MNAPYNGLPETLNGKHNVSAGHTVPRGDISGVLTGYIQEPAQTQQPRVMTDPKVGVVRKQLYVRATRSVGVRWRAVKGVPWFL